MDTSRDSATDRKARAPRGREAPENLRAIKGRGALSNLESRFLPTRSVRISDGWTLDVPEEVAPETRLAPDRTVNLITRNRSPDLPFDRSINPYKGCEHGCVYCFARPTHAYLDLSPGLDFETRIFFKTGVRERLGEELAKRGYRCLPIALGTNTDPYQPAERRLGIMRQILETLLEWRHPLTIVTKSQLVLRDLDLLRALARDSLVHVHVSVTTLSNELKVKLEPRTASPAARLRTVAALADAGVPVGVMVAPVIPFINDDELEAIVDASVDAGARGLGYILLRLPLEVAPLFEEWLGVHYPERAERVLNAVRQTRGGKLYEARWHSRMRGQGALAELLRGRFARALRRRGLDVDGRLPVLDTEAFRPPGRQGSLF